MSKARTALKYLGYAVGGIIIYALAHEYAWISYAIGAAWVGLIIREIVREAVRSVLWDELKTLREQSYSNSTRLEETDRKVSAIWNRIRQISGERT